MLRSLSDGILTVSMSSVTEFKVELFAVRIHFTAIPQKAKQTTSTSKNSEHLMKAIKRLTDNEIIWL